MSDLEEKFREVILEWKHIWMNQKQNSEADYQNYRNRAFGVDANMQYSLAHMLSKKFIEHGALIEAEERIAKLVDELAVKTHLTDCRDTVYRAEIAVLTDALKYYAGQGYTAKCIEGGKVAREALAELSKAQGESDDYDKMLKMIDRMTEGRDD